MNIKNLALFQNKFVCVGGMCVGNHDWTAVDSQYTYKTHVIVVSFYFWYLGDLNNE